MATELGPASRFVAPHDFIWNDDNPLDFDGHGTHVSGTIGQTTNDGTSGGDQANGGGTAGVAFNVKLMPVKVLASEWDVIFGAAAETGGSDDVVAEGIRYAVDNGAKIINMSLGASGPAGSAPVIEDAIKYAVGKGAFIALAGGNDFEDGNPTEVLAEIASRVPGAVSVAAVDKNKAHAFYSSTRPMDRARRAWRLVPRLRRQRRHSAADARSRPRRYVRFAPGPVCRAAVRLAGVLLFHRHLSGNAARLRRGGDAHAAGDHEPGCD